MRTTIYYIVVGFLLGIAVMFLLMSYTPIGIRYVLENEYGMGVYRMDKFTGSMWFCVGNYEKEKNGSCRRIYNR